MSPHIEQSREERRARVRRVLEGARRLADPADPLGKEARLTLPSVTGLSPAGVELGLSRHLETDVDPADLEQLVARAGSAARAHVILSANVFVGVVRAVAFAVAAAPVVRVRPSSREAVMTPLLRAGAPGLFDVADEIDPGRGDEVHVYGRAQTIADVTINCPAGVRVRAHGPGFGVAIVDAGTDVGLAAERLSWDVIAFDQRGCLSPRMALFVGSAAATESFAATLAAELEKREREVPRGIVSDDERRAAALYRQTASAIGPCHVGPTYVVGCDAAPRALVLAPPGRHVHVARVDGGDDMLRLLTPLAPSLTCAGLADARRHRAALLSLSPAIRLLELGKMQSPPLDGPVDLREMVSSTS